MSAGRSLYGSQGQSGGVGKNVFGSQYQPGAAGNILYGLFGDAGSPYESASSELAKYYPQAQRYQMPFYKAGTEAIPNFQNWLQSQKDPGQFINNLMGKYQESPFAKFQQEQAIRGAKNMGSATGLTGSTPLSQFEQQNARDISSQDMDSWLQHALGINTQYGAGQQGLIAGGQQSANQLQDFLQKYMQQQAGLAYGKDAATQGQWGQLFSGIGQLFGI